MSLQLRWESENALIRDAKAPGAQPSRSKTKPKMAAYEPFSDPDVEFDVTKWPTKKPVPSTVTAWDTKTSAPAGTVHADMKDKAKEKQ